MPPCDCLEELLSYPQGALIFTQFLTSIGQSDAQLVFWFACMDYRHRASTDRDVRRVQARRIYDTFLSPHAPSRVSVADASIINAMEEQLSWPSLLMFDGVALAALDGLERDLFPMFRSSKIYQAVTDPVSGQEQRRARIEQDENQGENQGDEQGEEQGEEQGDEQGGGGAGRESGRAGGRDDGRNESLAPSFPLHPSALLSPLRSLPPSALPSLPVARLNNRLKNLSRFGLYAEPAPQAVLVDFGAHSRAQQHVHLAPPAQHPHVRDRARAAAVHGPHARARPRRGGQVGAHAHADRKGPAHLGHCRPARADAARATDARPAHRRHGARLGAVHQLAALDRERPWLAPDRVRQGVGPPRAHHRAFLRPGRPASEP